MLLGGPPELRPGLALVLEVSPTRAAEFAAWSKWRTWPKRRSFMLPRGLGQRTYKLARGAFLHRRARPRADVEARWPRDRRPGRTAPPGPSRSRSPERALFFESQGELFGMPLSWVLQIVPVEEAYSPLPSGAGGVAGLLAHGQALWPAYSLPGMLGKPKVREALFVLAEIAGNHVALCAQRVVGIYRPPSGADWGPSRRACPRGRFVLGFPTNFLLKPLHG